MSNESSDFKTTVDKAIHSEDKPLGKRAPAAPFTVVALSYLSVLLICAVIAVVLIWLF